MIAQFKKLVKLGLVKKILFSVLALFVFYFVIIHKKKVPQSSKMAANESDLIGVSRKVPEPASLTNPLPSTSSTQIQAEKKLLDSKAEIQPEKVRQPIADPLSIYKGFRRLVDADRNYAKTPSFLTGVSSVIFELWYHNDIDSNVLPNVELKDVKSAFAAGIYPSKQVFEGLDIDGTYKGFVSFKNLDRKSSSIVWYLKSNFNVTPIQGIFRLTVDGVEGSCNTKTLTTFQNFALLTDDNGAILVTSCDHKFYMQLYKTGRSEISGGYYEQSASDEKYYRIGYVQLFRY